MRRTFVKSLVAGILLVSVGGGVSHSVNAWSVRDTRAVVLSGFNGEETGAKESVVVVDDEDNMIVRSLTAGTVQIDPADSSKVIGTGRDWQQYISKFNAKGELVWNVTWPSLAGGELYLGSHDVASNGDIYLSGYAVGGFDVDPGTGISTISGTSPVVRGVVLSLNSSGQFKWVREFASTSSIDVTAVKVLPDGNIAIAGNYEGTATLDGPGGAVVPTLTSLGRTDLFVGVLNSSGVESWIASAKGSDFEYVSALDVSSSGNILLLGGQSETSTFVPASGSSVTATAPTGVYDAFLWNLTSSGASVWVSVLGEAGAADQFPSGMVLRSNGEAIVSTNNNSLVVVNAAGAVTSRMTSAVRITTLAETSNGNVLLAGGFANSTDLDPTAGIDTRMSRHGSDTDGFVTRLKSDLTYDTTMVMNLGAIGSVSSLFTSSDNQWGITGITRPGTLSFANPSNGSTFAAASGADSMLFIVRYNIDGTTTPPIPSAPVTKQYTAGNKKATILWEPMSYAARYEVVTTTGRVVCNTTTPTCAVSRLTNGKVYTYYVKAYNYNDVVSASTRIQLIPGFTLKTTAFKVKKKPLLSSILTSPSKGTRKWKVTSGSCKISGSRIVLPTRAGSCKLSLSISKRGSYPAMKTTVRVTFTK